MGRYSRRRHDLTDDRGLTHLPGAGKNLHETAFFLESLQKFPVNGLTDNTDYSVILVI